MLFSWDPTSCKLDRSFELELSHLILKKMVSTKLRFSEWEKWGQRLIYLCGIQKLLLFSSEIGGNRKDKLKKTSLVIMDFPNTASRTV